MASKSAICAAFSKFRRRRCGDAFRYLGSKQIKFDQANDRIFLPKRGRLRYRNRRDVLCDVRNVTVSQSRGKSFASIQTQSGIEQPLPTATTATGIDIGIARFAAMSDGGPIVPLNSFNERHQRLTRYQPRLSREVKCNRNWKKASARVQQIHTGTANARKDFLQKTTTTISRNHALEREYRLLAFGESVP